MTPRERKAERLTEELSRIVSRLRVISGMAEELGDDYASGGLDAATDALDDITITVEESPK